MTLFGMTKQATFLRRLIIASVVLVSATSHAATLSAAKPNIIYILADDMGYADAGFNGGTEIKTPHLDKLAHGGAVLKSFYVQPVCSPTRAALLTGRYATRTGVYTIVSPNAQWGLKPEERTLAQALRDVGYETAIVGKWHLGEFEPAYRPTQRGFDHQYGPWFGMIDYFTHKRNGQLDWHRDDQQWVKGSGRALWGIEPDSLKGKLPKFLPEVPEVREDVADYLGECQAVDAYVGVLLKRLEETGESERTLVVLSGDHGMPGVPSGKCNLYDMGVSVAFVMRVPGGKPGRIVDDYVCLPDLASTFMEIGGVKPPEGLYGRSLLPLLKSEKNGQIDSTRDWVITGRERHVGTAREGNRPYPIRALRTPEFVYIRNFAPDRWPIGSPKGVSATNAPDFAELENETYAAFADLDSSPTKAWLITHRNDPAWQWHYEFAFGKRPGEELYDVRHDPDQVKNLATDPAFAATKTQLSQRLMKTLTDAKDPRVIEQPPRFELPPFTIPIDSAPAKQTKRGTPIR